MGVTETREVVIEATPAEIMKVLIDLERLPDWSPIHRKVEVLVRDAAGHPRKSKEVVKVLGITDELVLDYTVYDDGVGSTLISSNQQRAQTGRYTLTPDDDSTTVRFELTVDPIVPVPKFVLKPAVKAAMRAATDGLRQQVLKVKRDG
jgi:hypothetical protein